MYHCSEKLKKEKCHSLAMGAITGVAIGCGIGFAKGILLTPRSGKETRNKLKKKGKVFSKNK